MSRLIYIALVEMGGALIIWALIERFGQFWQKGRLRSLSMFLTIWVSIVVLHIAVLGVPNEKFTASTSAHAVAIGVGDDANDAAILAANMPKLRSIAHEVASGRPVDQHTHDLFWSLIPPSMVSTSESRQSVVAGVDVGMHFQKALWGSVVLSARAHEVVKTPAYEDALREIDPSVAAKAEAMLRAAASGTPYVLSNGESAPVITDTYAQQVLANLDATSARLKVLFDPEWHP